MKKILKTLSLVLVAAAVLCASGCSDFLETNSSTDLDDSVALSNTNNLDKILLGTYKGLFMGGNVASADRGLAGLTGMMSYYDLAGVDMTSLGGMGTSEHVSYTFADSRTQASGLYTKVVWTQYYDHVNRCNIVLDALDAASGTEADKTVIRGQAKAIRAIAYFQLILNYQQTYAVARQKRGVLLRLHADDPDQMPFSTVAEVYAQIVRDLEDAKSDLRSYAPGNVWRITAEVASAWLARVCQVKGDDWSGALANAEAVYDNHRTLLTEEQWCGGFDDFISGGYDELVWGYQNTDDSNAGNSTPHNMWFNADPSDGENNSTNHIYTYKTYFVTQQWVDLFDDRDFRAKRLSTTPEEVAADPSKQVTDEEVHSVMLWHRCTNADNEVSHKWAYNKFKHYGVNGSTRPDICLIRSAEMLLIMAEAQAQLDQPVKALELLRTLQRARNVAAPTTTTDKQALLEAIYVERRKELLGEGVTGMYDNCRLQKDVTREVSSAANGFAGHFTMGIGYWGTPEGNDRATLAANDYSYFLQIPADEFSHNDRIDQSEQNPMSGR